MKKSKKIAAATPASKVSSKRKLVNNLLFNKLGFLEESSKFKAYGRILNVKDGIASIKGLREIVSGELLYLPKSKFYALALNLNAETVDAVILGDERFVK
jgi:F-type H+/Na+-transporting ATPase subunit alpha